MPSSVDVIQGRYFSDLMSQPEALQATWEALRDTEALERAGRECVGERFERVVLTGNGGLVLRAASAGDGTGCRRMDSNDGGDFGADPLLPGVA